MSKWRYRSSATCWVVNGPRVELTFPTKALAEEYVDFKNSQVKKSKKPEPDRTYGMSPDAWLASNRVTQEEYRKAISDE